jgi:hypothetical protein
MAGANRDPIDVKRGSIREPDAEPTVLADQPDDARLAVTQ